MMQDDHIYTLNNNLNELTQRLANNIPDNDNTKNLNQQNINNIPDNDHINELNQRIVNHLLDKGIINKTTSQGTGDLMNDGLFCNSYITEALNVIKAQDKTNNNSDEPSVEDDDVEDIVIKPSSNYRVDEDRDPNYYKMIHHIDDLPTLIDNFLVYRCVLMLKEVFCDNTVILDIKQDIMHLIYNSDDINSLFSHENRRI